MEMSSDGGHVHVSLCSSSGEMFEGREYLIMSSLAFQIVSCSWLQVISLSSKEKNLFSFLFKDDPRKGWVDSRFYTVFVELHPVQSLGGVRWFM